MERTALGYWQLQWGYSKFLFSSTQIHYFMKGPIMQNYYRSAPNDYGGKLHRLMRCRWFNRNFTFWIHGAIVHKKIGIWWQGKFEGEKDYVVAFILVLCTENNSLLKSRDEKNRMINKTNENWKSWSHIFSTDTHKAHSIHDDDDDDDHWADVGLCDNPKRYDTIGIPTLFSLSS